MDAYSLVTKGNGLKGHKTITHGTAYTQKHEMECDSQEARISPPKSIIDSSPLQAAMDKNKESLKVKLLVRRTVNQLVEQGIMPSLKTSPAIYEQQRQLERAKTGDLLKAKIKQRPDRIELERRHILEHQEGNIDPSLAEKKRMLEKALLVDHLNSKISHRPGPLELIEKNILHAEEPIERIVKEGLVNYTSTDEAASLLSPESMVCIEEDSLSSEGETQNLHKIGPINVVFLAQPQGTIAVDTLIATSSFELDPLNGESGKSNSCNTLVGSEICARIENTIEGSRKNNCGSLKADIKEKSKKKNKHKAISKARSIKFHEYKGPPNAHKHSSMPHENGETNYQLIMKQQYLLEYLEEICKHPPVLPASSKMSFSALAKEKDTSSSIQGNEPTSSLKMPPDPITEVLNKLKVFQLKRYCKKYNLPVSGSKSTLVDRLKPYLHLMEINRDFEGKNDVEVLAAGSSPIQKNNEAVEENLLKEQQKRIAELQKQLKKSQEELEQIKLIQMHSHQDCTTKLLNHSADVLMEPKTETVISNDYRNDGDNITPMHTGNILSDMDIKITVHIDPNSATNDMRPKIDQEFTNNEILLNVIDHQHSEIDTNETHQKQWRAHAVNDSIISCGSNSSEKMEEFASNNETLDKLLGQVQPGIPNSIDKNKQGFKPADVISIPISDMTSSVNSKSLDDCNLHSPLVLNDYNDVNLLDFHMHIDDTCDNGLVIPHPEVTQFSNIPIKQSVLNNDNSRKIRFETNIGTDSNNSLHESGTDKDIFSNFDGLHFVNSEIYSHHRNGMDMQDSQKSKITDAVHDVNKNYSTNCPDSTNCLLDSPQNQIIRFPLLPSTSSNAKRLGWLSCNSHYDSNKRKQIQTDSLHENDQVIGNRLNMSQEKQNLVRFSFDDTEKRNRHEMSVSFNGNNNVQVGHVSPMDFDSLLSNIDLSITNQNCDRGLLDGSQEKLLYELQPNSLLDYLNDDFGMQNDSITCEINHTSY
ncbi:myocardin-related transcription factor B [Sabethes cyaneus]|uniref:myocardin-related transcription factor B n=1 Tax=Sabethes cyaneus TaxID=53552 RepID=UPI00237DF547|nr:myocardin-related transcription factor B [Sabethes cyaneus]